MASHLANRIKNSDNTFLRWHTIFIKNTIILIDLLEKIDALAKNLCRYKNQKRR